jgi:hypothetical protein
MNTLELYVREFTGIVKALLKGEKGEKVIIKGDFLFVSKDDLTVLLNKNAYETADNKLKFWRGVSWIIADDGHLTSRLYIQNKQVRLIKISLSAAEAFKTLLDRDIDRRESPAPPQKMSQTESISPPSSDTVDRPQTATATNKKWNLTVKKKASTQ